MSVAVARKEPVFLVWLWSFIAVRYSWCSSDEVGQKRWFLLITFSMFLRSSAALWAARDDVPLADQRAVIMSCLALIGQGNLGLRRSQNRLCSNSFQIFSSSDYRIFVSSQLRILSTLFNTIIYLFIYKNACFIRISWEVKGKNNRKIKNNWRHILSS